MVVEWVDRVRSVEKKKKKKKKKETASFVIYDSG